MEVARIAEIGACALCSSYIWHGGYNSIHAGGFRDEALDDLEEYSIDAAQYQMLSRYKYCQAPDRWELESVRLAERLETWQNRVQAKEEHETCKSDLKALYEKRKATDEEREQLTIEYKAKWKELEEAKEKRPAASSQKYKGIRDKINLANARARTSNRVDEEFQRRLRSEFPGHGRKGRYIPGPLVTLQPLTEDEVELLDRRLEAFRMETAEDAPQSQGAENQSPESSSVSADSEERRRLRSMEL
ncbi:MAG: hypothetical protein LQ346_002979 [Caloplaca aetnensis]|nr:MAG: hypothetical protein LQ346_002979 [Caloplaca aetnensis]